MEMNAQNYRFWVVLEAHKKGFHASDPERLMKWEGLTFQQRMRWEWYYRYRAALLQVEHPRWLIELRHGRVEVTMTEAEKAAQRLENKIRKAKADLTQATNRIERYKAEYRGMFAIEEDGLYLFLLSIQATRQSNLNLLEQAKR